MNPNPDKRKNGSRAGRGPARPQVGLDDPAPTHSTPSRRKRALLVKAERSNNLGFGYSFPRYCNFFPRATTRSGKGRMRHLRPHPEGAPKQVTSNRGFAGGHLNKEKVATSVGWMTKGVQ
jgi:hypothetical protein